MKKLTKKQHRAAIKNIVSKLEDVQDLMDMQIVAEKHENASILNYHELARYDTADRTRKVYDMFLEWLNADTGNTVFVFRIWDEEINDFTPSWNDQHKRQIPVV